MHQVLYRKWRPKRFCEVCGQNHITNILSYEVANEKTSHAYLFCGSRGTGKTTCAKILAKAINCEHPVNGEPCGECESCLSFDNGSNLDFTEMDAASNNGVENVRDIIEEVAYPPTMSKYRVYIIDEVHMLSPSAFNALLKTLEEPPANVVFILATTELQKLPVTIVSRCRRFDFRRIASRVIADRLNYISKEENIPITDDAALLIARLSQGGMRDAIGLLELASSGGNEVNISRVQACAGISSRASCVNIANAIINRNSAAIFGEMDKIFASSTDISAFFSELVSFYRDMLIVKTLDRDNAIKYLDLTSEEYTETKCPAECFSFDELYYHCSVLDDAYIQMQKNVISKRLCAEFALVKLTQGRENNASSLAARVSALERAIRIPNINITESVQAPDKKEKEIAVPSSEAPSEPKKEPEEKKAEEKPANFWNEIVGQFKEDKMYEDIVPSLRKCRAFISGDRLLIRAYCGAFNFRLINKMDVCTAIKNLCGQFCAVSDVKMIECKDEEAPSDDAINDLIE